MTERRYGVEVYFSEDPNLDMGSLERELRVSPLYARRMKTSLLGPTSRYIIEYECLEESKALQIVKKFSGTDELNRIINHIILNPSIFSFKESRHPSQKAIDDIRA